LGVRMDGGMVEQISHPVKYLHKMPAGLSWEHAAMVEPLSIALHVTHRAAVKAGEHVAISGAGTIGLLAAKVCMAYGAIPILMDPVEERLAMAKSQGVICTINPAKENAAEQIRQLTNGRMAEAVLECSGAEPAIKNVAYIAANSARIVFVGWPKTEIAMPVALFIRKELNLCGSRNSVNEFPESMEMITSGKVDVGSVITQCVTLEAIPETLQDLAHFPEKYLKVVALV
jgi:L-gulonate 5-dehydrogenase